MSNEYFYMNIFIRFIKFNSKKLSELVQNLTMHINKSVYTHPKILTKLFIIKIMLPAVYRGLKEVSRSSLSSVPAVRICHVPIYRKNILTSKTIESNSMYHLFVRLIMLLKTQ